jgi:GntR family transcriptional regulator, transcriptional repressor for pyruvate dehydrogenase complex
MIKFQASPCPWHQNGWKSHVPLRISTAPARGRLAGDIVAIHTELRVSRNFDETESPERFRLAVRAYKKLLALIEARDADGARRLWRSHMESAAAYLLKDDLRDKPVVELFA